MRLANKVAVITGGAGGIGEAAAARFVEEGAYVLLTDLNADALAEAAARLGSNRVSYLVGDVTSAADNQAMIDTATERYGGVDVFLANAGIEGDVASLLDYPEQRFDELMAINVKGPFLGLRCACAGAAVLSLPPVLQVSRVLPGWRLMPRANMLLLV